jgi:multidrug efflux pump subunit AcrA (membrane-fusion protein)
MGVLAGCNSSPPVVETPPAPVSVSQPLVHKVIDYDTYDGRIAAVETLEVRSKVRGYLEKIYFQEGAEVKDGDLLFLIDPEPFEAALAQAEAQLESAEASSKLANAEYDRTRVLFRKGAVSQEDMDVATGKKAVAMADVAKARAAVREAKVNLDYTVLRARISGQPSPVTGASAAALMASPPGPGPLMATSALLAGRTRGKGKISRAQVTLGNLVNAGGGETLLTTIVSQDPIYVFFDIPERALNRYREDFRKGRAEGAAPPPIADLRIPVYVGLEGETGYPHKGLIDFADNRVNPSTGTIQVRGVLPNAKGILDAGMRARIRVPVTDSREAVLITERAVANDQGLKFVYVVNDQNVAERRDIKLGRLSDGLQVVEEGLKREDWVVVNGIQRVRDGQKVEPRRVSMPGAPAEASNQGSKN